MTGLISKSTNNLSISFKGEKMKVRSLKDIERDIRKETEKANTAAQYDMYASSVDDMFRAALFFI